MTIHLSKDLESFVEEAVRAGRYASADEVVKDALARLRRVATEADAAPAPRTKGGGSAGPKKPLTNEELDQHLLKIGLLSRLPDADADFDDPDDQPVEIRGEPLSETVIRERR